jgi:hypothetical protein
MKKWCPSTFPPFQKNFAPKLSKSPNPNAQPLPPTADHSSQQPPSTSDPADTTSGDLRSGFHPTCSLTWDRQCWTDFSAFKMKSAVYPFPFHFHLKSPQISASISIFPLPPPTADHEQQRRPKGWAPVTQQLHLLQPRISNFFFPTVPPLTSLFHRAPPSPHFTTRRSRPPKYVRFSPFFSLISDTCTSLPHFHVGICWIDRLGWVSLWIIN